MNIDLITCAALLQSNSSLLIRVPKAPVVLPNPATEQKTQPDVTPVSLAGISLEQPSKSRECPSAGSQEV